MDVRASNLAAATVFSLALALLAGCGGPGPSPMPPPPPPEASYDRAPVELAGAPAPAPDQHGLAGGFPDSQAAPSAATMAPIPNPEDLPAAERHRIYGTAYDGRLVAAREDRPAALPYGDAPARPSAAPPAPRATASPAPRRTPAGAAAVERPTAAKPLDPRLTRLQTALAPSVSAGAVLTLSAPLSLRLEGPAVLTLPPSLFDTIRQEAAKVGLGGAARTSEVSATLSGQGYEITPNGPQTVRLKPGEAASFQWQIKPGAGGLGPLRAQVDAALRGQRTPMTFPLTTITKAAPVAEPAPARFDSGWLNLGYADVPGVGRLRGETLVGGGLLLLALALLVLITRNASEVEARARRHREARKAAENAPTAPEPSPANPSDAETPSRSTKQP